MKAVHDDPGRRYETARGLRDDIDRHLRGDPIEACPPSRIYRLRKWWQRHHSRWILRVAALAVVVLIVVSGWMLYRVLHVRYRVAKLARLQAYADQAWNDYSDEQRDLEHDVQLQTYRRILDLQVKLFGDRDPATLRT